jgi:flagellar motor switch protein FliN/FliY
MGPQAQSRVEIYRQAWSDSLALLLSRMAAGEWRTETEAVPAEFSAIACVHVSADGELAGGQRFSFAAADLAALLGIFLGEEVALAGELDATQKEALEELIRQWAGLAASALKPGFGEVTLQVALAAPAQAAGGAGLLRATDGTRSIALTVELDQALVSALNQSEAAPGAQSQANSNSAFESGSEAEAGPSTESPSQSRPAPASAPGPASPKIEELLCQGNLELLMDVELAVMLRFGSRQATLREVLDLSTGAVLELDRELQQPVDLVLNDKVIARGEVVVVDGNYGLRVMEVASPQQRVNSL